VKKSARCCFYCGATGEWQADHFPKPRCAGGTSTVRACLHCHNLKDRLGDSFVTDYMRSNVKDLDAMVMPEWEVMFLMGKACLLDSALDALLGDIHEFPPAGRIAIARRARVQFEIRSLQ
jgi:hypothetical protein